MSIDAGGLAQMTYQSPFNNTIGVSGPGFGSRGKGHHIKRLSVAPPSKISTIDETQQVNTVSTPRTARGHLLAGLRTAPKSATVPTTNQNIGLENSRYAPPQYSRPQTTTATSFPSNPLNDHSYNNYAMADHVLAPPAIDFQREHGHGIDQSLYDELVATNNYLAQQQRALQQQLLSVQAAAQQFGGLNLNANLLGNMRQMQSPISSPMSMYTQQYQHGLQPVVSPVPGSPGVFAVFNPLTGQSSFVVDNAAQHQQQQQPQQQSQPQQFYQQYQQPQYREASPPLTTKSISPPPQPASSSYQRQSPESLISPNGFRSKTPPKTTPSPQQEVEPLPPPSANAFRRGHKKNVSSVNTKSVAEWTRSAPSRPAGVPPTPVTGTFGPGQGRAGEHPIRQPKGPPLIQELQEKPTSKHEGSKNFATRQRRRAVHDLVRAGRERTGNRQSGSGSATPASENEFNFSVSSSDNDDLLARSALSSKPSLGSLRAAAIGAIGSERKNSRERGSVDSMSGYSTKSLSSDEGNAIGGNMIEVDNTRRRTPLLVLSSAEKRKSVVM